MNRTTLSIIASLLSVVLLTLHLTDDIVRGMEKGGLGDLVIVPIVVLWLYGALVLCGRRSGNVIVLLSGLLGLVVPVVHFRSPGGVTHGTAGTSGEFFWVWSLLALGVTSLFALILSVHALLGDLLSRRRRGERAT